MIDTVIGALHEQGIHEIYVVVGYLKESLLNLKQTIQKLTLSKIHISMSLIIFHHFM